MSWPKDPRCPAQKNQFCKEFGHLLSLQGDICIECGESTDA